MSFSDLVKKEICSGIKGFEREIACLYGILLFANQLDYNKICFQTENDTVADVFSKFVKTVFKSEVNFKCEKISKKNNIVLNSFLLTDKVQIKRIFNTFGIKPENREINLTYINYNKINYFTSGVFLSCGSISDPNRDYHFEFVVPTEKLSFDLGQVLQTIDIPRKVVMRKNHYVLYIKESEYIEDILTFIGARQCRLDFSNIIILKDVRNKVNRIANCDNANIDKIVKASANQVLDIELIEEHQGFNELSADLRELAELRLQNPELSLRELGEMLSKPLGRSGVNRRFAKIAEIANTYRHKPK